MKTVWQILKILLVILVVLVITALDFWLVIRAGLPIWVGLFILLGLLGLFLCYLFIRKLFSRRNEQRFIQQIIDQDESYAKNLPEKERGEIKDLQSQWREAVKALKKSHLKKYGNPLYILPWYVVLGESGSGKTTALQSARLSSPFVEVRRASGISGTRNCDWWFFEKAIILDTAGRYAIPVNEGRDKDEWQKFLRLLVKFRKKEPINGLVITIAADKLASAKHDDLEKDGRNIRRRMNELMRTLGAKFPIYVLVTKCDLVQGINRFCDNLSEESLDQAMGTLNHKLSTDVHSVISNTIDQITQRLRDLRLLVFHKSRPAKPDPALLLFPEEFERLKPGLEAFMNIAFQATPYQETPLLRGIFFSSGKQEGSPYSHFLKELGLIHDREVLEESNKGYFLHDFFSRILPADRHLFKPTQGLLQWRQLTQNIGLAAWLAIAIAICGLLSFSFTKNMIIMRNISRDISNKVLLKNDLSDDIIRLDEFRQTLLKIEKKNRGWWIPRFGLDESIGVEKSLKEKYCKQFYDGFLANYNKDTAAAVSRFTANTPNETVGAFTGHLVRCINLIKGLQGNKNIEELKAMPFPSYEMTLQALGHNIIPQVGQKLTEMYFSYVLWNQDSNALNQEKIQMQTWLAHIIGLENTSLNWMVALINQTSEIQPLTLENFWGGSLSASVENKIEPAFTLEGMKSLQSFIQEMENALNEPLIIANKKTIFETWYRNQYFDAWRTFSSSFSHGSERLGGVTEWLQAVSAMGSMDKDPYFLLIDRIAKEMKPYSGQPDLPTWVQCVYEFKKTELKSRSVSPKKDQVRNAGIIKKATTKVGAAIAKMEKQTGQKASDLELEIVSSEALYDYKEALSKISSEASSNDTAFQMAEAIYREDPVTSQTAYFEARRAFDQLRITMVESKPDQEQFWNLIQGPMDFLLTYISREAACQLQKIWKNDVLMAVQGTTDLNTLIQDLLNKDGYARKFIMGPAKPFIASSLNKGFFAKTVEGQSIPFDNYFFTFLNKGARSVRPVRASYTVIIHGEPTSANKEAAFKPDTTELEMQCSEKTYRLVNRNYPVREKVTWSPRTCGEVVLRIKVAGTVLSKKYSGDQAFISFLKDFEKGSRTFYSSEFPNERAMLKGMGIDYIIVRYKFEGQKPVIQLLNSGPKRIPEEIAACWDK